MASPYQQQQFQRKILYAGLILVLFSGTWVWRHYIVDAQANELSIREQSRGEVELSGAVIRLGLTGSRGLATCVLWSTAQDKQKKNEWNEFELVARSLTKLQPHHIAPWLFQSWNIAYNVSVESDRVNDKYFFITRGIEMLAEGERQNRDNPDLRWNIGWFNQNKICQSDEKNTMRSLFQLSMVPPNERDPARFRTENGEFNWVEFEKLCQKWPQLARRLRTGIRRDTEREQKRQFTCEKPDAVVQFFKDNKEIPSLYETPKWTPENDVWHETPDRLRTPGDRFPLLPPPRTVRPPQHLFDPDALTYDSPLLDEVDAHQVSGAWYAYAQEPIPAPSDLPGIPQEITDRAHQRRPQRMTTLIFRNYPAQAARYYAERLEEEGWYDEEPWEIPGWFEERGDKFVNGEPARIGGGRRKWSLEAWQRALTLWREHGESNLILFTDPAKEKVMSDLAKKFSRDFNVPIGERILPVRDDTLSPSQREEHHAARFMWEYHFYRQLSNFPHHYFRALVEAREDTVIARKLIFQAEMLNLSGSPQRALDKYNTPHPLLLSDKDKEKARTEDDKPYVLLAWRDKVLGRNEEFRRDDFIQEQTCEMEMKYLDLYNSVNGRHLKQQMTKLATVLPLLPPMKPDVFTGSIIAGPFAGVDEKNQPWVPDVIRSIVLGRMSPGPAKPGAPPLRPQAPAQPQASPPKS
jgi:hypothetical protein